MPRKRGPRRETMGRPILPIDWDEVDRLLFLQAPGTEIADSQGIAPNTLYERCFKEKGITFSEYSQQKRNKGVGWLRQKQVETAEKNCTMQIWLGKQWMGQREDPQAPTGEQLAQAQVDPLMKSVYDKLVAKGLTPLEAVKKVNKALMDLADGT